MTDVPLVLIRHFFKMMALTKSASDEARLPAGDDNRGDETPYLALMVRLVGVPSPESN